MEKCLQRSEALGHQVYSGRHARESVFYDVCRGATRRESAALTLWCSASSEGFAIGISGVWPLRCALLQG
eukprot:scaffold335_cov253-Pinguiococcus_pyrenoidosus.AAC.8